MDKGVVGILVLGIFFGVVVLGGLGGNVLIEVKQWECLVVVKGLLECEYVVDKVIWLLQFVEVGNDFMFLYNIMLVNSEKVKVYFIL